MLPERHEVHDLSAMDAANNRKNAGSRARLFLSGGIGTLLAGVGIGFACWGASFLVQPKIVTTEKVVVTKEIVEVPRPWQPPQIGYPSASSAPITTAPPVSAPVAAAPVTAAPTSSTNNPFNTGGAMETDAGDPEIRVGSSHTPASFVKTRMYRTGVCAGILLSHRNGVLRFDNGSECYDATEKGVIDVRTTSTRHDNHLAVCGATGKVFSNGRRQVACYALIEGVVEDIRETTTTDTAAVNDPITQ